MSPHTQWIRRLVQLGALAALAALPSTAIAQTLYNSESTFLAAIQNASTETFETRTVGTTALSWDYLGGTASLGGGNGVVQNFCCGGSPIGSRGYYSYTLANTFINFSAPVSAFGLFHVDIEQSAQVRVFRGALSTDYALPVGGNAVRGFWGIRFDDNAITRVELRHSTGDAILWDNMTVGVNSPTSVVPEPMSMLLLGTGLGGLAVARRRRRRTEEDVV
jgi:hypothetical protein